MIIYPLPSEQLDDVTLDKQIKAIAQVLANVHWHIDKNPMPPLAPNRKTEYDKWASECRANYLSLVERGMACCVEYTYRNSDDYQEQHYPGGYCKNCDMQHAAFVPLKHKLQPVIEWARDNVPDLPTGCPACDSEIQKDFMCQVCWNSNQTTPFPLVMPEKYKEEIYESSGQTNIEWATIESYRNYYKSKLPKDAKWTRRTKPEWL